jgi:hypothetical protein
MKGLRDPIGISMPEAISDARKCFTKIRTSQVLVRVAYNGDNDTKHFGKPYRVMDER